MGSTGGGGVPAAVDGEGADLSAEALAQGVRVVQQVRGSGGDEATVAQQCDVRRGGGQLLEVVRAGDAGQLPVVRRQLFQSREQVGAARKVQPGRGFVEQQQ